MNAVFPNDWQPDDSATVPVYACVSLCARQTDHPQTVGTLLAEKGSERWEGDGCAALNTCDIPIPIQRSVFGAVPLAMQAYLYVVYGQC